MGSARPRSKRSNRDNSRKVEPSRVFQRVPNRDALSDMESQLAKIWFSVAFGKSNWSHPREASSPRSLIILPALSSLQKCQTIHFSVGLHIMQYSMMVLLGNLGTLCWQWECNSKRSLGRHKSLPLTQECSECTVRHFCAYSGVREAGTRMHAALSMPAPGRIAEASRGVGLGRVERAWIGAGGRWGSAGWWADWTRGRGGTGLSNLGWIPTPIPVLPGSKSK